MWVRAHALCIMRPQLRMEAVQRARAPTAQLQVDLIRCVLRQAGRRRDQRVVCRELVRVAAGRVIERLEAHALQGTGRHFTTGRIGIGLPAAQRLLARAQTACLFVFFPSRGAEQPRQPLRTFCSEKPAGTTSEDGKPLRICPLAA